jgi:hypothetical protein
MESVVAGQTGNNSALLTQISNAPYGVKSVTENGQLILMVGDSFVGGDNVVGKRRTMEITSI